MQLTVTISGDKQTLSRIQQVVSKFGDFKPEFTTIGKYLKNYFSGEAFLSQGQVFSQRWQPLKEATKRQKMNKYPGKGPLERTGNMRKGFVYDAEAQRLTVDNTTPYYKYHQSSEPRKVLPRRVTLAINNPIKERVRIEFKKGIDRVIQSHGI